MSFRVLFLERVKEVRKSIFFSFIVCLSISNIIMDDCKILFLGTKAKSLNGFAFYDPPLALIEDVHSLRC